MPPTVQTRPGRLDWLAYVSQQRVLRLSGWPDGYIDARTFELQIRGLTAVVGVLDTVANTVTFTATMPSTGGKRWLKIVDTSTTPDDVIVRGELYVSDASAGGSETTTDVTVVTVDEVTVDLTVTVLGSSGGGGGGAVDSVNGETGTVVLTANEIGSTATGDVSATNVQAAIAELASEKATVVALAAEATLARNADNLTSGTVPDARIPSGIARDAEVAAAYQALSEKAAAGGYASLDGAGKVPSSQIPDLALSEYKGAVASQAAMTALTAEPGDWCTRTDLDPDGTFMLTASPASTAANWVQILAPGAVTSVNGEVGAVSLVAGEIPSTATGSVSATNVQAAIAELESEKASTGSVSTVASDLAAHLADTSDVHDASAVSYNGGVGMSATDVEAAIDELATEKANDADLIEPRGGMVVSGTDVDVNAIDVQEFTTAGGHTWTKPDDLTADAWVHVYMQGGGAGAGSGRRGAEGSDRAGGWGGHSGPITEFWILASALNATEAVTVGAGGAGGAARTTDNQNGANGTAGGASTFKSRSTGQATPGNGGTNTLTIQAFAHQAAGAINMPDASSRPQGLGAQSATYLVVLTPPGSHGHAGGGGSGMWRNSANTDAAAAGNGGNGIGAAGGAGGVGTGAGTAGSASTDSLRGGGGGGGGARTAAGAAGGWPGGGGGGGGIGVNATSNSGAGGAGAAGVVRITTYR